MGRVTAPVCAWESDQAKRDSKINFENSDVSAIRLFTITQTQLSGLGETLQEGKIRGHTLSLSKNVHEFSAYPRVP